MKNLLFPGSVALLALLLAGCHSKKALKFNAGPAFADLGGGIKATNQLDPRLLQTGNTLFTLGPGDRLEIVILGHPETRAETFVGPDGKIYYHLLPGMDVWGLTLEQTRERLEQGLAGYMTQPQVAVTLREVGSKYVWLLGRLNKPGIYPMPAPTTLLEGLALAGGTARSSSQFNPQELADLRHSFIMRQGQFLPVDFQRLLRQGDTSQNVVLQPDDFVYVPSAMQQEIYVLGAVNFPRAVPYIENMTLVGAIAGAAGPFKYDWLAHYESGIAKDAYLSHVAIVRGALAQPQIAVVDYGAIVKGVIPDVALEPGDIVYVPNSPYRFIKSYLNMIVNTFVTTVAANEGIRAGGGQVGVGVSVPVSGH